MNLYRSCSSFDDFQGEWAHCHDWIPPVETSHPVQASLLFKRFHITCNQKQFICMTLRSAYAASKHALQAFSDCLRAEVAKDGIQVTVVNPSYIQSNLSMNSITNDGQFYGKSDSNQQLGLSCDQVATRIISGIKDGEHEIIIGSPLHRLTAVLRNVLPSLYFRAMIRRAHVAENTSDH